MTLAGRPVTAVVIRTSTDGVNSINPKSADTDTTWQMGKPLWLELLNFAIMPSFLGTITLLTCLGTLGWPTWYGVLLFVPFWLLGLFVWNLGVGMLVELRLLARGPRFSHPPCPKCAMPLATQYARQCLHCGADWHEERNCR
jgi:hypothetical protein